MKTDAQIEADVTAELMWDPVAKGTEVRATVQDGVVTLAGHVDSYVRRIAVERAARRIAGVRGIVLDLAVRPVPDQARGDAAIAGAALDALRWHSLVPDDRVTVEVENGWVTLAGEVDWAYQSASAEQCVHPLLGVKGVTNSIHLKQRADPAVLRQQIAAAFARHAQREASHVHVEVDGGVVTLSGRVHSLAEHEAALGTAYAAHGVTRVVDRLEVVA